jgi:hypothetical protein
MRNLGASVNVSRTVMMMTMIIAQTTVEDIEAVKIIGIKREKVRSRELVWVEDRTMMNLGKVDLKHRSKA